MSILVPNINHCGQKDLSFEVRHKVYARPLGLILKKGKRQLIVTKLMTDIIKFYNYIFYLTVMALNWCSHNLIIKPLIKLMESISVSEKRINEVRKSQLKPIDNWDQGSNVIYAFGIMMWNLSCIILTFELLIIKTTKTEGDLNWTITFWTAVLLSIIINYFSLWKSDKYRIQFNKFKLKNSSPKEIFGVAFIHVLTFLICGLIIKMVV